jgi:hypothetical protein
MMLIYQVFRHMKTLVYHYKYSTVNFEKFLPKGNFGQYVGYDSGAIWRIGNPGNRNGRKRSIRDFNS